LRESRLCALQIKEIKTIGNKMAVIFVSIVIKGAFLFRI
jgi:hypothetical protein